MAQSLPTVLLLGLPIVRATPPQIEEALEEILGKEGATALFTPNAEMLTRAARDPHAHRLLRGGDLLIPDGVGLVLYGRAAGVQNLWRFPGIELGEWVMGAAARGGLPVYLLGGEAGVADLAAERLRKRFPRLSVVGSHHGYVKKEEEAALIEEIRRAKPRILFVCMGFPRQEEWILGHRDQFPSLRLAMGLGGALDVWSGRLTRAPRPMRRMGLEWLWRVLRSPKRIPRLRFFFPFCRRLLTAKRDTEYSP